MTYAAICFLSSAMAASADHETLNEIYRTARNQGVVVGAKEKATLPAPTLPDGLDAKGQRAALIELVGLESQIPVFTRDSIVAPHKSRIIEVKGSDPNAPAYHIDFWFVAYGDLGDILKPDVQRQLLQGNAADRKVTFLTADDLAQRGIPDKSKAPQPERYSHTETNLINKVQLRTTHRTIVSKTDDSIILASELDPRFAQDQDYPIQWQPINNAGQLGKPQPYLGSGSYIKITRLAEPKGALLIESHSVYVEPKEWFDGKNLLRPKIASAIQNEVRDIRRTLLKLRAEQ
ncbi:MAG: hypothetical protein ACK4RK_04940 [Gemmataceae bacterium]